VFVVRLIRVDLLGAVLHVDGGRLVGLSILVGEEAHGRGS